MRYTAFVAALALVACNAEPATPDPPGHTERVIAVGAGSLRQDITVTPQSPTTGDTITINSVLVNVGTAPVSTTATTCGLHLKGTLQTIDPFIHCAGYSQTVDLAPGDSVTDGRVLIVTAPAGEWVIEVRQLLDPDTWVAVAVRVR